MNHRWFVVSDQANSFRLSRSLDLRRTRYLVSIDQRELLPEEGGVAAFGGSSLREDDEMGHVIAALLPTRQRSSAGCRLHAWTFGLPWLRTSLRAPR
jgi:hypothetical protein